MRKYKSFLALIAAVLVLFSSCEGQKKTAELSLSVRCTMASCEEGSTFVTVKAEGSWDLSLAFEDDVQPWAELNHSSGLGSDYSVIMTYQKNYSEDARRLVVILKSGKEIVEEHFAQLPSGKLATYLEMPAVVRDSGHDFFTVRMNYPSSNFRNYSFYYSYADYLSLWVAYPLNKDLEGSGSRTNEWGFYPGMEVSDQPNVTTGGFGAYGYDRGHHLPSADRKRYDANLQTFYGINMTPQLPEFNQEIWEHLESRVRGYSASSISDTLYIVTGCVVEGSSKKVPDRGGHRLTVPVAYYKALLRYKPNAKNTVDNSGYNAIAFYLEHKNYNNSDVTGEYAMSIRELEKKTGIDFFTNLQYAVDKDTYDKIEEEDPLKLKTVWGL